MPQTLREYFEDNPEVFTKWSADNDDALLDKTTGSKEVVLWHCDVYDANYPRSIVSQLKNPTSCSICNGSTVFTGINDLETVHPELAAQWDFEKNDFLPSEVKFSSGKKAYWKCEHGHTWRTGIYNRVSKGTGCKLCEIEKRNSPNSVTSQDDDMKKFFVSALDSHNATPTRTSKRMCLWRCDKGHEWKQKPRDFHGCPYCLKERVEVNGKSLFKPDNSISHIPELAHLYSKDNEVPADFMTLSSARIVSWVCDNGHIWDAPAYSVKRSVDNGTSGCPHCIRPVSKAEKELADFVIALEGEDNVVLGDRDEISPYELDIYVPGKKIAVEYNGLFWHSEQQGKDRNYHKRKHEMCRQKGIQLITIWEDDWNVRKEVAKSMISHKLQHSKRKRVYARSCTVVELDASIARTFCNSHHIQGFTQGTVYYGLENKGELVAVSVWRKTGKTLYLSRYCTSATVVGGMGKLLKQGKIFAQDNHMDYIVTFSDNEVSDGGLYEKLGFVFDKELKPDYSYIVDGKRSHKFNFRRKKFKNDENLLYDEKLSESQLAQLNGIFRVWDCGKIRWIIDISSASS